MKKYKTILISISILFSFLTISILMPNVIAQDNYNFGSETVNKGYSADSANRNSEDSTYQTLTEADQYPNTNFSGSSENIITGTGSGGSFPTALDTDDSTRRNYIEENTAGGSPTYQNLRPNSDSSPLTMVPTPTGTHYLRVAETTVNGDGDTSYIEGVTNAQEDRYGMSDATDPGGSPNIDVIIWHISDDEGATSNLQVGIVISSTNYIGWQGDLNSGVYTNYSYEWTTNPAGGEWTLTQVNALYTFLKVTDANPDTRTTQLALRIEFNPTDTYELDTQITYSSVTSTGQTISYNVICQGYRNGDTENIKVQAWNYITLTWVDKITVSASSDTDYNFDLTTQERDGGTNEIKLRIIDNSGGDLTQTTVYFDLLKINRIEKGYAIDVEMTASGLPSYGDLWLRIKGYTSTETFNIQIWNWGGSSWSSTIISITALTNTWYSYNFTESTYLSSGQVKIQYLDGTSQTSDTTQDICYIDVVWISHYHIDPTLSQDGCDPITAYKGTTIHFFIIVSDFDNELPSANYPKVWIEGSTYTMTENTSDPDTFDGKAYYYDKSDFIQGIYDYYFITKDANSGEITSTGKQFEIENRAPTITNPLVDDHEYRNTWWEYDYEATDPDSDTLTWEHWDNNSLSINSASGLIYGTTPNTPGWYSATVWVNDSYGGSDSDSFILYIDNRAPVITTTGNTSQIYDTYLKYIADATDADLDTITWEFWTNSTWISLTDSTVHGIAEVGYWECKLWANDSYGGSDIEWWNITVNPVTNDPPYFTSSPVLTGTNNTLYNYQITCYDNESDIITYNIEETNATFLNINPTSGLVYGTPNIEGNFFVNVSINDGINPSLYQNYTLTIEAEITDILSIGKIAILALIIFMIGLMLIIGFKW